MVRNTNRSLWHRGTAAHNSCMSNAKKTAEAIEAGRRLRTLRDGLGLSLEGLSQRLDGALSASRIGNYEQGSRKLNIPTARLLARELQAHPAYLMGLLTDEEHRFLRALSPAPAPMPRAERPPLRVIPTHSAKSKKRPSRTSPY